MSYMYILQHTHDPPNNQSSSVNRSKVGALQGSRRRKEGETLLMQGGGGTPQLGPSGGQFGCSDEDEDFLSANRALQSRVIKPFRPPYFRPEESDDVRPTSPNRRPKVSLTRKQKTFTSGVRGSPDPDLSTPFPTSHVATCNFIFNFFSFFFSSPATMPPSIQRPTPEVPRRLRSGPSSILRKPCSFLVPSRFLLVNGWGYRHNHFISHFIHRILPQEIIGKKSGVQIT